MYIQVCKLPDTDLEKYIIDTATKLARANYNSVAIQNQIINDIINVLNSPNCRIYIMMQDNKIIGSVVLDVTPNFVSIEHFHCDTTPHDFLNKILSTYKQPIIAQTHITNLQGRKYYSALGFKEKTMAHNGWIELTYAKSTYAKL